MKAALLWSWLLLLACGREPIDIYDSESKSDGFDFGRQELLAAITEAGDDRESPEAIAKLAARIDELKPKFNRSVEEEAERQLVFLAIGPMAKHFTDPIETQLEILGPTVWPIALRVELEKGETPRQYAARLCSGPLALECKHAVPEAWPTLLSNVVWRRLKERAREAYVRCGPCKTEPEQTYDQVLEQYRNHQTRIGADAAVLQKRAHPRNWPRAGENAADWPQDVPLLELLGNGSAEFRGKVVDENWRSAIRDRGDGVTTLGVHVGPSSDVRRLRSVLDDARAAGYQRVALQARTKEFPYQPRTYYLSTAGKAKGATRVEVRPVDSIQILVEVLDNRAAKVGSSSTFAL